MVEVVVPYRGGCPWRENAWEHVQKLYSQRHPDWKVTEARAPDGPWVKALAVNPAVEASDADVIVLADADCWTDNLEDAVAALGSHGWAIPHTNVRRLSRDATQALYAGREPDGLDQPPYPGVAGGGFVVTYRETLTRVPLDARFVGWGQEDLSHAIALTCLTGDPWRGTSDLIHLWHPPQERLTRKVGSVEGRRLFRRYLALRRDRRGMRALIEEGKPNGVRQEDMG